MFKVSLKRSHPLGVFHRAGLEFTREGRLLGRVPKAVMDDPWLVVEPVVEAVPAAEAGDDAPVGARRGRPRKESDAAGE